MIHSALPKAGTACPEPGGGLMVERELNVISRDERGVQKDLLRRQSGNLGCILFLFDWARAKAFKGLIKQSTAASLLSRRKRR